MKYSIISYITIILTCIIIISLCRCINPTIILDYTKEHFDLHSTNKYTLGFSDNTYLYITFDEDTNNPKYSKQEFYKETYPILYIESVSNSTNDLKDNSISDSEDNSDSHSENAPKYIMYVKDGEVNKYITYNGNKLFFQEIGHIENQVFIFHKTDNGNYIIQLDDSTNKNKTLYLNYNDNNNLHISLTSKEWKIEPIETPSTEKKSRPISALDDYPSKERKYSEKNYGDIMDNFKEAWITDSNTKWINGKFSFEINYNNNNKYNIIFHDTLKNEIESKSSIDISNSNNEFTMISSDYLMKDYGDYIIHLIQIKNRYPSKNNYKYVLKPDNKIELHITSKQNLQENIIGNIVSNNRSKKIVFTRKYNENSRRQTRRRFREITKK